LKVLSQSRPRLYHPVDDPEYRFITPTDPVRKRILANLLADCEEFSSREPWEQIPEVANSPFPFHQLYITFYSAMEASALIEQYAFAWRITHDDRWLKKAKQWLLMSTNWKHGDEIEESFYCVNRYMEAYALALDWLASGLTEQEEALVIKTLVQMMNRWWPEVDKHRHDAEGGNHASVDNGHFGMAALQLLGHHPAAPEWVAAVVDRFRASVMPHGCGKDGEPEDGINFWNDENIQLVAFCDALRNVVGIDLYKEFPERISRPLKWARYCLASPKELPDERFAENNSSCLTGVGPNQLDAYSPVLLRLAQEAGDNELRDIAIRDPLLGRIHLYGYGVKQSSAECMEAWGPYAYLFYDPNFQPTLKKVSYPLCKSFTPTYGTVTFLRSSWAEEGMVVQLLGYNGGAAHSFSNLHVQYSGHPVLKTIGALEALPVGCGNLLCVGGQDEFVARIGELERTEVGNRVGVEGARTHHECWVLGGRWPALVVAVRRKKREIEVVRGEGGVYARLNGKDYLQYVRERYFSPGAGEMHMKIRLHDRVDGKRPQIIFNTGMGVPDTGPGLWHGTGVNQFNLGFWGGGEDLTFAVTSQDSLTQRVSIPANIATLVPGKWHEIAARWGGFNDSDGQPFIEIELDKRKNRFDDPAAFGEMKLDTQGMKSRKAPLPFYIRPQTEMAFGAAMQIPGTGLGCDIGQIELVCPERERFFLNFEQGLEEESGSGLLEWKLNPVELRERQKQDVVLGAGPRRIRLSALQLGGAAEFREEVVAFSSPGFAAGSLRRLKKGEEDSATRLLASTTGDYLILLFVDQEAGSKFGSIPGGFELRLGGLRYVFDINGENSHIMDLRG
jgi:hypothetical protein